MFNQCPCSKIWIPFKHKPKDLNGRNLKNKFNDENYFYDFS